MKRLLKNGTVVNVFTGELIKTNVLFENGIILGVDDYGDDEADEVIDAAGKYICPGFIDGHIHIESTMLTCPEFAKTAVSHGTTAVIADPHEIANVSGKDGLRYMIESSEGLPLTVYFVIPSCVPATSFDESGAVLSADDIEEFYSESRVLGLGEVMNYVGVVAGDGELEKKIKSALSRGLVVNGHAPLLSGKPLDKYISAGIGDDHECSSADEAKERIRKGQRIMIRQGTAARNLSGLISLFDDPWEQRCLLVTDDKHPADLISNGHIDSIIRSAVQMGKSAVTGIRMATLHAAECFGLKNTGAVAPGYKADLLVLDDLDKVIVRDVYKNGEKVVSDGKTLCFDMPKINDALEKKVRSSFNLPMLSSSDFDVDYNGKRKCHVISLVDGQLLTDDLVSDIDFDCNNGIDIEHDILKIAVIERHHNTGHIGNAFIKGIGLKEGAIASSVAHDSHNLIVIGTNTDDMAFAANRIRELGGGIVSVKNGKVVAEMPLPIGGLMSCETAERAAEENEKVRESVYSLGVPKGFEPFMIMSFLSLPVIPHLKLTTKGLVNVDTQSEVTLAAE